ncbi:hypothetical protein OIE67_02865 [Nonomuraea fuscirosea]|uniref:hypothetical protein n=1 Tax=Nonomuraea fuscirosea TaxID=1291556 RepID=UPI002DD9D253|nr:hypothetical protein [Nonomuraea fuscirosea]WSA53602.1 hypothetical protein OIE67_02865 [Nonomuraea fuscirosea]
MFGLEPGDGAGVVRDLRECDPGRWTVGDVDERAGSRVEEHRRREGAVQVVREQPVDRVPAIVVPLVRVGQFAGVGPQEVVLAVAAGCQLGDQMRRRQVGESFASGSPPKPAKLAMAGTVISCPGWRPIRRNTLAAGSARCRYDHEKTVRRSVGASSPGKASRLCSRSRSWVTSAARENCG